jgi:DNA-binding CsgD family transcriptional regulator
MTGQTIAGPAAPRYRPGPRRAVVAALLDRLRTEGGAHVVTGEPGGGRTAFLDFAARSFEAGPVLQVRADPAGAREPYAGLRALCRAADPQAPFATPSAGTLLALLRRAAGSGPLLVCVDDAHHWDAPSRTVLAQAAAHLAAGVPGPGGDAGGRSFPGDRCRTGRTGPEPAAGAEPGATGGPVAAAADRAAPRGTARVGLLISVAGHLPIDRDFGGLPVLRLDPLVPADAAALLDEATDTPLDPVVRDTLVTEAEGNPALLLALARRLSPAQLRGERPLPRPPADAHALTAAVGGHLLGLPPDQHDLLLTVMAAVRASGEAEADARTVLRAAARLGVPATGPLPGPLDAADGRLRPRSPLLGRALYAAAPPERRRAAHRALARSLPDGARLPALLHRSWATTAPGPGLAADLAAAAADPASAASHDLRRTAYLRAAELTQDGTLRAHSYTCAAEQALLGGHTAEALRLLDAARSRPAPAAVRGRAELLRGATLLRDGPVDDARESLLLAARLLAPHDPVRSAAATLTAADAAWSAGDAAGCLRALGEEGRTPADGSAAGAVGEASSGPVGTAGSGDGSSAGAAGHAPPAVRAAECAGDRRPRAVTADGSGPHRAPRPTADHAATPAITPGPAPATGPAHPTAAGHRTPDTGPEGAPGTRRPDLLRDYRTGMRAVLEGRFDLAAAPLRRVLDHPWDVEEPEPLLRAAAAALLLGEVGTARRAGARALAAARTLGSTALEPRALEYLAYAELRAGRHALARTHAEEGLRGAARSGQRNTAAHHHAVLALTASIEGETDTVAGHVAAALATARRHGLAQAGTLAQWAAARADLGRGRPREAADRLGPLVRPGPRRGHFAVWMLAVPCYVEAAALAGDPDQARAVVEDFAVWAACGADPHAPAQLLRCRALLAGPDTADELYRRALDRHEENAADYERARTELLYGKWLRRRRRLREARERLGAALIGFERCGARPWAQQAAAELRANGAAADGRATGELSRLTPQQLRIARYVAEGATNREVALSLSVSTRTVDYHLRNVFAALGVRSRVELARMVEQAEKSGAQL